MCRSMGRPLVVFAEGSRTNGSCVMPFQLFDPTVDAVSKVSKPKTPGDKATTDHSSSSSVGGEIWGRRMAVHVLAVNYQYHHYNPAGDAAASLATVFWRLAAEVWPGFGVAWAHVCMRCASTLL